MLKDEVDHETRDFLKRAGRRMSQSQVLILSCPLITYRACHELQRGNSAMAKLHSYGSTHSFPVEHQIAFLADFYPFSIIVRHVIHLQG